MNGFVDECRKEWSRLGVPDSLADEMAAELTADLAEAEAEGASAEDLLGAAASDPRAFAHAWAAERGVVRRSRRRAGHLLLVAAIASLALVAIGGAVLVAVSSPPEPRQLALASRDGVVHLFPVTRGPVSRLVGSGTTYVFPGAQAPFVNPTPAPGPVAIVDEGEDSGFDARVPGLILLSVGLAGVLMLTSFGLLRAPRLAG